MKCIYERRWHVAIPVLLTLITVGCGKSYNLGTVDGQVLIKGKPGNKLRVEFVPEPGTEGPISSGKTDDQGKFTLITLDPSGSSQDGVVVGEHRVVLYDLQLAESPTGKGVPQRLPRTYSGMGTTPLRQTITEGEQSITIEVP